LSIKAYEPVPPQLEILPSLGTDNAFEILDLIASESQSLNPYKRVLVASELAKTVDFFLKSRHAPEWLNHFLRAFVGDIRISRYLASESFYTSNHSNISTSVSLSNTSDQFGYFWPRTAQVDRSGLDEIARLRIKQMTDIDTGLIRSIIENGFLDIGCGPGRYVREVCALDSSITAMGIDASREIIESNQKSNLVAAEYICDDVLARKVNNQYGFVMCNGVAHHTNILPPDVIKRHAELTACDGYYFIFLYGDSGLELHAWETLQSIVKEIPVEFTHSVLSPILHPLRLQGQLDHMYGVFYKSNKLDISNLLADHFSSVIEVPGVAGLDVTPSAMKYLDPLQFQYRYGEGNIRFLCKK